MVWTHEISIEDPLIEKKSFKVYSGKIPMTIPLKYSIAAAEVADESNPLLIDFHYIPQHDMIIDHDPGNLKRALIEKMKMLVNAKLAEW